MSRNDNATPLAVAACVLLGGVLIWRERDKMLELAHLQRTAPSATTTAPRIDTGALLPAGSNPHPVGSPAASQADLLAVQRQTQIETLQRDLSRVVNDMKVQLAQADAIKAQPIDPAFKRAVEQRVWDECMSSHKLFPHTQCQNSGTGPRATQTANDEWSAKKANDLKPIQAVLSRLNAEQLAIVDNLSRLNVQVPAGSIIKGTV